MGLIIFPGREKTYIYTFGSRSTLLAFRLCVIPTVKLFHTGCTEPEQGNDSKGGSKLSTILNSFVVLL